MVDDSELNLGMVVALLQDAGFNVLSANCGSDAIKLAEDPQVKIDLLLSDVDMPNMAGPALGQILKANRPNLHVMLMSGAENGALLVLNYGWAFIQKPFIAKKLVQMLLEVLHSENRSQPGGQEFDSRKDKKDPDCDECIPDGYLGI